MQMVPLQVELGAALTREAVKKSGVGFADTEGTVLEFSGTAVRAAESAPFVFVHGGGVYDGQVVEPPQLLKHPPYHCPHSSTRSIQMRSVQAAA
jgi:hypothetical protein